MIRETSTAVRHCFHVSQELLRFLSREGDDPVADSETVAIVAADLCGSIHEAGRLWRENCRPILRARVSPVAGHQVAIHFSSEMADVFFEAWNTGLVPDDPEPAIKEHFHWITDKLTKIRRPDWQTIGMEMSAERETAVAAERSSPSLPQTLGEYLKKPKAPSEIEAALGVTWPTVLKWHAAGTFRMKKLSTKSWRVHVDDWPAKVD